MMEFRRGNLLEADAEALVNTVNTVGIMGKGIALQFRQAFPDNFRDYEAACRRGEVELGRMFVHDMNRFSNPKFIINFPTKQHWRSRSRLEDIQAGLDDLARVVKELGIRSVAVPPLGCGNGGLDWRNVRPLIQHALGSIPNLSVQVFEPTGAPESDQMKVATTRPRLTAARAAILALMNRYAVPGYELTMLEVQKLAYFLQAAGEPLKLRFAKNKYGPYTEQLHHVLQRLEGHYIHGYGDRSRDVRVNVSQEARKEAELALMDSHDTQERFARVSSLIDGFETPHGMELLATVHWVATQESMSAASDLDLAVQEVHKWSEYKRRSFKSQHIAAAWDRLKQEHWF